mmetsp:Transcript_18167/g.20001  ORF Transcript_18167/g.20001 Transcript_18167/m.20001 type:complete len:92 (-) Transcript_18167:370-645(-)
MKRVSIGKVERSANATREGKPGRTKRNEMRATHEQVRTTLQQQKQARMRKLLCQQYEEQPCLFPFPKNNWRESSSEVVSCRVVRWNDDQQQ